MKKNRIVLMTVCLLAGGMMVQGQPAFRQGRPTNPVDTAGQMGQMRRMSPKNGSRSVTVQPGQFRQRGSMGRMDSMGRPDRMRSLRGGIRQMPQGRMGQVPYIGMRRMQRGGAFAAPGERRMERGGSVPGFGLRNRQGGLQRGLQPGRGVDPENRIENEVNRMKKSLDLSSDQVKKITSIKKKQAKKEIKAYKKSQKKVEARRKKQRNYNEKIESVLNDEQVKRWKSKGLQR